MVTAKNLHPTALAQHHIDLMIIYPFLQHWEGEDLQDIINKIRCRMMNYQKTGKIWVDQRLYNINTYYLNALVALADKEKFSKKQRKNESLRLMSRWGAVANPLLNYPREMTIESGGKVYITFDYFLVSLFCKRTIRTHITEYMRYSTEMATQKRYV